MKKEYLKPTARSHELRCRSMVAQSPQQLESHSFRITRQESYMDSDSDNDTMWAD